VEETRATLFAKPSDTAHLAENSTDEWFRIAPHDHWPDSNALASPDLRANLFAVQAAAEAITSAGLTIETLRAARVGVCLGSTAGGTNYHDAFMQAYFTGQLPDAAPLFECYHTNSAQFLSRHLGLHGPTLMVNNACTSGADAIGIGSGWIANDLCDIVICGGTETILRNIFLGFRSLMLCSATACKPFDRGRTGLVLGEGAGIVVLEKPQSPRAARALLLGYGAASDCWHSTAPHPEARGLNHAVRLALAGAQPSLGEIDFINAHGTATPSSDLAEGHWLRNHVPAARVAATKGYTGHTLGAAGGIEAVFTALSLLEGKLPASRGFTETDPDIGITPTQTVETGNYRSALSLSLGFGGTNSALLLGRTQ
jgi:3-oxoacyl-[acyl-carrier-protein] synthase-1/3-oxoacyl-[acyl-carrier-protein] synthase II